MPSQRAPAWELSPDQGCRPPNPLSKPPPKVLRGPRRSCRKKKKLGEKTDDHYHHRRARQRPQRARNLYHPRDFVAADSVPGAGLLLFLSRSRQSRFCCADHDRRAEILADRLRLARRHLLHWLFHL